MYFKRWIISLLAALILVACGSPAVQTVARLDNVILTRPGLDQRIALIKEGLQKQQASQGGQAPQLPSDQEIEQQLVQLFIQQNLVLNIARQRGINVTDADVDQQISLIRTNLEQRGTPLDDAVRSNLGFPDAASSDFRQFISSIVAQQKLGETLVTTDTVRAEVTKQVQEEARQQVDEANSSHILVKTEAEAQQVLDRLAKGEKFEDLAKELSTDSGSGAKGGELGWVRKGQFVPEFEKAIFEDLKPGETTKTPVQSQFGYHIIRLNDRRTAPAIPEDQVQQVIDQRVLGQIQTEREQAVQQLIETERKKATDEGRLEEPVYPTPTPIVPAEQGAPGTAPAPSAQPATVEPTAQSQ